ncbi:hypothetical protein [Occallatibacter savannae]|uniref:hypothetical protein n=1 Tax=Occallatibacter savannae TaxID=1002691 RepID=UPI0013A5907B|nr:hypothetical protein [Occallatibacter savannae]
MQQTVFFRNVLLDPATPNMHPFPEGVAYFSAGKWWYSGVNYGGSARVVPIEKQDLAALKEWILNVFGDASPEASDYRPGTAFKRISLPLATSGNLQQAVDLEAMAQGFVALRLLVSKMQDIFETVEPGLPNQHCYGHKIRELLLLACMEVEASWVAVLKANDYVRGRYTTRDYVKLLQPMLLDRWILELRSYPRFPRMIPFHGWDPQAPTQSLDWYDAYNKTKHDREGHLLVATLGRAVNAVAAAVIMHTAQFSGGSTNATDGSGAALRSVFNYKINSAMYTRSCYIPNAEGGSKTPWEWDLIDYPFPP